MVLYHFILALKLLYLSFVLYFLVIPAILLFLSILISLLHGFELYFGFGLILRELIDEPILVLIELFFLLELLVNHI